EPRPAGRSCVRDRRSEPLRDHVHRRGGPCGHRADGATARCARGRFDLRRSGGCCPRESRSRRHGGPPLASPGCGQRDPGESQPGRICLGRGRGRSDRRPGPVSPAARRGVIIRGGTIVTARGVERADIVIADGRIVEVGANLDESGTEIDAKGLHAFPGGIDSHVHLNEPGRTEWEDIAHGSAALAAGGYTAFVDMPLNNLPVTTTVDAFDLKLAAMRRWAKIDYGLWGGLVPGNLDQLAPLVERGAMGFKA